MLKGTVAVIIAGTIGGPNAAMLAALGAFLGHLFPVWLKFHGGKGVATYLGVLLGLFPLGVLVGFVRGGLSLVNITASTFFGAISGSSLADTASVGSVLIPEMEKKGYPREFSTAVTVSGSVQALLTPPSHNSVIYSLAAGGTVSSTAPWAPARRATASVSSAYVKRVTSPVIAESWIRATASPRPASTCRSRQLKAVFNSPSGNQRYRGAAESSRARVGGTVQSMASAASSQNPSGSCRERAWAAA